MIKRAIALFVLTTVAGALLHADPTTIKYPEDKPNFSITFPDGWKIKQKESAYVSMANPDESICLDFWALNGATNADGEADSVDDLTKDMSTWLKDIKLDRDKNSDFTVNGIKFICYSGAANTKDGNNPQDIQASLCSVDGGKTVYVIMYYGDKGAADKNKADLNFVTNSIKQITE